MAQADFWNNRDAAQATVSELKSLKAMMDPLAEISSKLQDLKVLAEIAEEDTSAEAELASHAAEAERLIATFEFQQMLSGPDDPNNAYLAVHAGAGGTESCDWTEMLLRMYSRWADRKGFKTEVIETTAGEEAGLRRATLHVIGRWAYGYLKAEIGVHRLVRISPFDANKRRHTSFAAVDVTPELPEEAEIEIKAGRAQGGYLPLRRRGRTARQQDGIRHPDHAPADRHHRPVPERPLAAQEPPHGDEDADGEAARAAGIKRHAEISAAYDAKGEVSFGYQIRSYVLQPYQMVKDLRTDEETGNVEAVLDGEIDRFIESYLKQLVGKQAG